MRPGVERRRPESPAGLALFIPGLDPGAFPIERVDPSPCTQACPAGINVKSYVSLIAEGRFSEALEVVRERCPLPGICGRICHHPCEAACKRSEVDQPVAIRALKRFVADVELDLPRPAPPPGPHRSERVAVIGSGPAGLTAAYDLRLAGYPVTVIEAEAEPGGMLRYGIADYRLPTDVLDTEIEVLLAAGIVLETGCRIGSDRQLEELLANGYSAVLVAVGAQRGRRLGIEGEQGCAEVEDALTFLRRVNQGDRTPVEGKVLVIGGGSTAIEAARAARRLGAEAVEIVYRRHRNEMPADGEEIRVAAEEGIGLRLLTSPARILRRRGRLHALECLQVALGEPDASGRRRPIPIPGSEHQLPADRIFSAVGQESDFDFLPAEVRDRVTERGRLRVDPANGMTPLRSVFAAGDVVSGPASVIDAIAAGHNAAQTIRDFLEGGGTAGDDSFEGWAATEYEIPSPPPPLAARRHPLHTGIRAGNEFSEVELALSPADAMAEAARCMRCGPCSECLLCAASCGRRHVTLRRSGDGPTAPPVVLRAPARVAAAVEAGVPSWLTHGGTAPLVRRSDSLVELTPNRVTIDERHCRGCSRCLEVCGFDAIHLVDPRAAETVARVDPALCRGCNLCAAVCPTDAVVRSALAAGWWGERWSDLYTRLADALEPALAVIACQRRAESVREGLARLDLGSPRVEVVPVRCSGQLGAGELLEIIRHGAGRVLVAGCVTGSCRYSWGPQMAAEQVARARSVLAELNLDRERIAADWAVDQGGLLEHRLVDLVAAAGQARRGARSREATA